MKIEYHQWHTIVSMAVKLSGKWGVYINNGLEYISDEDKEIWAFIRTKLEDKMGDDFTSLIFGGLFLFDSESEAEEVYNVFTQPLTDSSAIYACLYDNRGVCLTENT